LTLDFERARTRLLIGMSARSKIFRRVARAFAQPRGLSGSAAGWIMGHRYSNVRRSRWVVDLLDVQPTDHVLEIGFGPGVAIAELAERVTAGRVVGVDSSPVMLRQARRRNAAAIAAGLVRLHMAPVRTCPRTSAARSTSSWPSTRSGSGTTPPPASPIWRGECATATGWPR
jgi:16S rRNA C967 or C1407 C5-methylase (RsmB/RsmF family)